ncbi:translesion error-prone DNA polymerase V autoproteolytic subunit [Thiomicrorhabdus sp. zzn3]|uniref:LexA family protein n=1 Tax=Thiomicrorhabdus sp. zzn3 TaxID=3039775 RepID=UPI0024369541|nr:translesion error-prone DNA polymerase V autoproteolytic subunit [Thiomicrorhabdus sp. zzn3]MDG6777178.1 translesion error-prone DNA polymerase V autoproteolytic subunit [Thiomicrorhabdus sp. zzn3]
MPDNSTDQRSEHKQHGGARTGAGRKKGSGRFGEPTKVMRIPASKVAQVKQWLAQDQAANCAPEVNAQKWTGLLKTQGVSLFQSVAPANEAPVSLPLFSHKVVAGFPSPADDYIENRLDLNEHLIRNQEATFLLVVEGDSMQKAGIKDGDILVVDRSIEPSDGKIVIAALDGELTVKRLSIKSTGTWLVPENDDYPPIPVREEADMVIWGVVTATISRF